MALPEETHPMLFELTESTTYSIPKPTSHIADIPMLLFGMLVQKTAMFGKKKKRLYKGSWDEYSVFTPNIWEASRKYYLFYTEVKPTPRNPDGIFENNLKNDVTAIGVAVSDSPKGPFVHMTSKPILAVIERFNDFDSYRVDDACLIYYGHTYYLYYKGRSR